MLNSQLEFFDVGEITVIRFRDARWLDVGLGEFIEEFTSRMGQLIDEMGRRKVLLNLQEVDFMGAWFKGKMVMLHQKLKKVEGRLVVCCLNKALVESFEMSGLPKLLHIEPDEESGLAAF